MVFVAETTIRSHLKSLLYNIALCWDNNYLQLRFVPAAKDKMKGKKDGEDEVDEDKDDPVVT